MLASLATLESLVVAFCPCCTMELALGAGAGAGAEEMTSTRGQSYELHTRYSGLKFDELSMFNFHCDSNVIYNTF